MNLLTIIGNLCGDPVSRTTQAGKNVTTFTVAVNRRKTANAGQQEADYFRVSAWGELGNLCHKWLIKGKKVCVVGHVSLSTYKAQNGETRANMDVFAESVEFLSPANTVPGEKPVQQEAPKTNTQGGFVQVNDEPLPF